MRLCPPGSVRVLTDRPLSTIFPAIALIVAITLAGCGDEPARPEFGHSRPALTEASDNGRSVTNEDRSDPTDRTIVGLIGRLQSVDRVLDVVIRRMGAISASVGSLPGDSKPAYRDALAQIQERAQYVSDVADLLLACDETDRPSSFASPDGTVVEADRTDPDDTSTEGLLAGSAPSPTCSGR
jgi:hypothetical protein